MSEELLQQLAVCVERGKVNQASPYPPDMKGQDGADELTRKALDQGVSPNDVLEKALIIGMGNIGKKFSANQVFVPDVLMAAKAMTAAMGHLKPFLDSGQVKTRGTFVIGTVQGDLPDIGKNLVAMMLKGANFGIVDLGTNVPPEKFVAAAQESGAHLVCLSALLTTTMPAMKTTVEAIKAAGLTSVKIMVGGAPVTQDYANEIGADGYSPDAASAVDLALTLAEA